MAKPKLRTNAEVIASVRGAMPPPSRRYVDRKKQANKRACRGRG